MNLQLISLINFIIQSNFYDRNSKELEISIYVLKGFVFICLHCFSADGYTLNFLLCVDQRRIFF